MPPKFKNKRKVNLHSSTQYKSIKFRLMDISLKVDGYIYQNKLISDTVAKLYIQEVSSYKNICGNDPRSLQVIEKLIHCMKGIINERQELKSKYSNNGQDTFVEDKDTHVDTPSPVYSVTDEDKMLLSQNLLENNHIEEPATFQEVETIDQCSDDEVICTNKNNITQDNVADNDIRIEKAISNLSIQEDDIQTKINTIELPQNDLLGNSVANDTETVPNNEIENTNDVYNITNPHTECSQSILQSYSYIDTYNTYFELPNQTDNKALIDNLKKNITATNKHKNSLTKTNKNNDIDNNVRNNNTGHVKLAKNKKEKKQENKTSNSNIIKKTISKKSIDKAKHKDYEIATNLNSTGITFYNKDIITNIIKQSEPKKRRTQKKKTVANSSDELKEKAKKASKRIVKVNDNIKNNANTTLISNKNDLTYDSLPQIYTRNVEEDLSWMENIRYVREHTKEEYDNNLNFEDSFWENYTLPDMWNNDDFNI